MKLTSTLTFFLACIIGTSASAQVKVVIMGSSTAYGVGASVYSNSWAGRFENFYNKNNADGLDTLVYNIAAPGYDTYQEMPGNFVPPPNRPLPDDGYNVTKALSFNPDVVIINLPSNDINYGYAKSEMISNLRYMSATIFAQGKKCYVTTPQPRNDMADDLRDSLRTLVDSVEHSFGPYAINFWECLVTNDGLNMLKDEYRATPSPLHVNDNGHELLFQRVWERNIFDVGGPLALRLSGFAATAQNNNVQLKWHTEQQSANTVFALQRSTDARSFETIYTQQVPEARTASDYNYTDRPSISGTVFYRLKILENNRITYSSVVPVNLDIKIIAVTGLFVQGSSLRGNLGVSKSQSVQMQLINSTGAVVYQSSMYVAEPGITLNLPVGNVAAGQYFLRVVTANGMISTTAFKK
ncbi:MAG: SGNH/GDSL hydrolase family protein [Bacteroidetes bacterium]|nr:SGNH/GDSL hydrolase family protein [Bacteroidota bacterium]